MSPALRSPLRLVQKISPFVEPGGIREMRCGGQTPLVGDAYWWVFQGRVRIVRERGPGERPNLLDVLGPGAVVGPAMGAGLGRITALADPESRLLEIGSQALPDLARADPELVAGMFQSLARHQAILRRRLGERIGTQVPGQLTRVLQLLAKEVGRPCAHDRADRTDVHGITHQDLADLLGSSRPYVSLLMGSLQKAQLLSNPAAQVICFSRGEMAPS